MARGVVIICIGYYATSPITAVEMPAMLTMTFLGVGSAFAKRNFNSNCLFEFWERPWPGDMPSKPPDDTLLVDSASPAPWPSIN